MLLDFGSKFVDSKHRQLRLSAFSTPNKMGDGLPRCKTAIMMRAYRLKPVHGYCPAPENAWAKQERSSLEKLEALLFYYHTTCKATFEKMADSERAELLSNIFVAAAEGFIKRKAKEKDRDILLLATHKYFKIVCEKMRELDPTLPEDHPGHTPIGNMSWINYTAVAELQKSRTKGKVQVIADEDNRLVPKVLLHDEKTFNPRDVGQATRSTQPQSRASARLALAWDAWLTSSPAEDLSADAKDMAAIILVLSPSTRSLSSSSANRLPSWRRTRSSCGPKRLRRLMLETCCYRLAFRNP